MRQPLLRLRRPAACCPCRPAPLNCAALLLCGLLVLLLGGELVALARQAVTGC
jgi:hypothetical protein